MFSPSNFTAKKHEFITQTTVKLCYNALTYNVFSVIAYAFLGPATFPYKICQLVCTWIWRTLGYYEPIFWPKPYRRPWL